MPVVSSAYEWDVTGSLVDYVRKKKSPLHSVIIFLPWGSQKDTQRREKIVGRERQSFRAHSLATEILCNSLSGLLWGHQVFSSPYLLSH